MDCYGEQQQQQQEESPTTIITSRRKERKKFPTLLELTIESSSLPQQPHQQQQQLLLHQQQPLLVIQSPKTPTLSRKLKAVSLDAADPSTLSSSFSFSDSNTKQLSDEGATAAATTGMLLDVATRDVFSMPNTPKRRHHHQHIKLSSCDFDDHHKSTTSSNHINISSTTWSTTSSSNLKRFASNSSISSSQTLKTLPEIMMLHDFTTCTSSSDNNQQQQQNNNNNNNKSSPRGLLERRGSNASLTIDLGTDSRALHLLRLNSAKSVSNLYLTSFDAAGRVCDDDDDDNNKCVCFANCSSVVKNGGSSTTKFNDEVTISDDDAFPVAVTATTTTTVDYDSKQIPLNNEQRRKSQDTCNNCIIYESIPSKTLSGGGIRTAMNFCQNKPFCSNSHATSCWVHHHAKKSRRKSLSNENLYVPPCGFCQTGSFNKPTTLLCAATTKHCNKGNRKAYYPRQSDIIAQQSQMLSDEFKLHLQNVQYLQTASNLLSLNDLLFNNNSSSNNVSKNDYDVGGATVNCSDNNSMGVVSSSSGNMHREFWEVPLNLQEKCYVSGSQSRNRYRGLLPNEHSRVHLPGPQTYIHANYIKGPDYTETAYIATQGPMAHTCQDFWEMIWFTNSVCIVMLTGLIEKGRNKCELYFPLGKKKRSTSMEKSFYHVRKTTRKIREKFIFDSKTNTNNTIDDVNSDHRHHDDIDDNEDVDDEIVDFEELNDLSYGDYKIKYLFEDQLIDDCCTIRYLELTKLSSLEQSQEQTRLIRHYWYRNWQDHKMANPEQVLQIALHLLENNKKYHPIVSVVPMPSEAAALMTSRKSYSELKTNNNNSTKLRQQQRNIRSSSNNNQIMQSPQLAAAAQRLPPSPVIVAHCSAGIGRTGCFLAILNGIQQLRTNLNVDILGILCSLRLNRGGMVQTAEQYELIHRVMSLYANKLNK